MSTMNVNTGSSLAYGPFITRLQRHGLLPFVRRMLALARRDVSRWVTAGCPSPAPTVVKTAIIKSYLNMYSLQRFIETGTFMGTTIDEVARGGIHGESIELNVRYLERAKEVFRNRRVIKLHYGDSGVVLPELIAEIDEPCLFWLDGHYSGGDTAIGSAASPISSELDAILAHKHKGHVVLIDDARDFVGKDGYPHLDCLLSKFRSHPHYRASVSADIIRITPHRPAVE